jgi:hypothetical protein
MTIHKNTLIDELSSSVGQKQAKEVLQEAIGKASVRDGQQYDEDEVMEVLDTMKELNDVSSIVRVSANTIQTRMRTGDI